MQEILLIILIVLALFYLPRLVSRRDGKGAENVDAGLSGPLRLAIAASGAWPLLSALYFEPWDKDPLPFLYFGVGPVTAAWLCAWVLRGYKKGD